MKRVFTTLCILHIALCTLLSQVTTIPSIIQQGYMDEITVIFNPNEGNKGMVGATECYAHTGITVGTTAWMNTPAWCSKLPKHKMTQNAQGNWELKITPDMYTYYGVSKDADVRQLCFVFNDGKSGGKEGKAEGNKDIFVNVEKPGLAVSIDGELSDISELNKMYPITCNASAPAQMTLSINGEVKNTTTACTKMNYTLSFSTEGDYTITLTANDGSNKKTVSRTICAVGTPKQQARPEGVSNGIYYGADGTSVTLCTYAASKTQAAKHVFVIGDMNDWTAKTDYQLKQDGNYFWTTLTGLTPGKEYRLQYLVMRSDGTRKQISDLYSEKLLHQDDQYEPRQLDPNLLSYPDKGDGYVTVIQPCKAKYNWSTETLNFQRPNKDNLVIYELWVYDHTPKRSIPGLMDRLDYLENLGVNCIELMPVNEFDGNVNWGYSPNHYFALDKAYGSSDDLKRFVDECHKRGMAVILDMVFNHATGNNPMNKLYPYGTDLSSNPWFNVSAPHSDNVYEDWNHGFEPTREHFTRVLQYWLQEYKVDGYRMDLSHGLCSDKPNTSVENLKYYYENGVKAVVTDAYFILEHWGSNMGSERPQLVNAGMMCWQNTCTAFQQTAMGWLKDGDSFAEANLDSYVSYSENHDEERCFFKAKQWGDGPSSGPNMRNDESVRASRIALNLGFQCLLNGPQLFYHFAELGFDNSKFQNASGVWGKDGYDAYGSSTVTKYDQSEYKMSVKMRPESMGWFKPGPRMNAYVRLAQAIQLRTRILPQVFSGNPTASTITSGKALRTIQWGTDVFVAGNFSATATQSLTLPSGTWYDYYEGGKAAANYTLQPGELRIFTGSEQVLPTVPDHYDLNSELTDINAPASDKCKFIKDGILYILHDGVTYDVTGRVIR